MSTQIISPMGTTPLQSVGQPLYSNVHNNPSPLRYPTLEKDAHLWIISAVLIPIVVAFSLCIAAACIYRYRKRKEKDSLSIDPYDPTDFNSSQSNRGIAEGQPPSYEIISETYKNLTFFPEKPSLNEQAKRPSIQTNISMSPPSYRSDSIDFKKSSTNDKTKI